MHYIKFSNKYGNEAYQFYLTSYLMSKSLTTQEETRQATREFNKIWEEEQKWEFNLED
tara:strand:+ start:1257 stop:1430 length:174 start_codon:yes stop_codon:yes gene_type:complete